MELENVVGEWASEDTLGFGYNFRGVSEGYTIRGTQERKS